MKFRTQISVVALSAALFALPTASAQADPLGGLIGINTDNGLELNVLNDTAKVRLGGSDNNIVDATVLPTGNGGSVVDANVGLENGANANVTVLGNGDGDSLADVNANIGGGSGVGVDISILNPGGNGGGNGGGGNGGGGNGGGGNGGGGNGGGGNGGGGNGGGGNGGGGNGGAGAAALACDVANANQWIQLIERANYQSAARQGWPNATGVQLHAISLCPEQMARLRQAAAADPQLRMAVMADALVSTALSRSRYTADDVLLVMLEGTTLNVYVD